MKTLFKGGNVVNVFSGKTERRDVLVEGEYIVGVGEYSETYADTVVDVSGKYLSPGFIDGHIHIESTMLCPAEFARVVCPRGTTSVIADPHEIANVAGVSGIRYMIEASRGLPISVYIALPSCVPATPNCEAGAILEAEDLEPLYAEDSVVALGEVMNYFGVIAEDEKIIRKIERAKANGRVINGHAPLLSGNNLSLYVSKGITDDHECSSFQEAIERISLGQRIMIRQGTAAKNLEAMLSLFDSDAKYRCMLVSDDKHPADLLSVGHIDDIIRCAVSAGKNPVDAIRMASICAAEHFGLKKLGAIAPGFIADIAVLEDLEKVEVAAVYKKGVLAAKGGEAVEFEIPSVDVALEGAVRSSFNFQKVTEKSFKIEENRVRNCRVISVIKGELITEEKIEEVDFSRNNGIDTERDILKVAVIERHKNTGHIGLGFIHGIGLKCGAIASSVSHDAHNLIVMGASEGDMALAAECVRNMGGGLAVIKDGRIIAKMPLPIGGLMTDVSCAEAARQNEEVRAAVHALGVPADIEPFMTTAFVSLPVIPHLKMTTYGLIDVNSQKLLPLFAD